MRRGETLGRMGRGHAEEQSFISNLPKTGVFILWCCLPASSSTYVEMLSQRCNIHLGTGSPGGCIGLQCYTKYPRALTSLMKSPLAAAAYYCTLPCLSHRDLSLDLSVCLFCQTAWLAVKNSCVGVCLCVCVTACRLLPTLTLFMPPMALLCVVQWSFPSLTLLAHWDKNRPKRWALSFLSCNVEK